jgi:hypothetical protein
MTAPITSIRRRRRLVGWSARFALLAGGRAATWFRGIVFSLTRVSSAVGRSLLAALRSANEVATDEALMGLQRAKLRAARLASQFCNGSQRKSGDVLGNFGDLGVADFEVGI